MTWQLCACDVYSFCTVLEVPSEKCSICSLLWRGWERKWERERTWKFCILNTQGRHGTLDEEVMLMPGSGDVFIKNSMNISLLQASLFYRAAANHMPTDLKEFYTQHLSVKHSNFQSFMTVKLQVMLGPSRSVKFLYLNNMRLVESKMPPKRIPWQRTSIWQKCLNIVVY